MKAVSVQTHRVFNLLLTERELVALKCALAAASVDENVRVAAAKYGVSDLDDDDFTQLYGEFREMLEVTP